MLFKSRTTLLLALIAIGAAKVCAQPLAQPLAWQPLPEGNYYEYSGFSGSGRIYEINRTTYNIAILADKPFWAPRPGVYGQVALWPAKTLLIVHISTGMHITIDGRKVGFADLAVGQMVSVQYSVYHSSNGGLGCGARSLEGWNSKAAKR